MTEDKILQQLHALVAGLGISCRRSEGDFQGGICRLKGRRFLILNHRLPPSLEIDILCHELAQLDLSNVYLVPALRRQIESRSKQATGAGDDSNKGS